MQRLCALAVMLLVLLGAQAAMGSIVTADVAVYSPGQYKPLVTGMVWNNWDQYYCYDLPTFAEVQDFLVWQVQPTGYPNPADATITFEVLTDGPVLMALTTRSFSGPSQPWTTRAELEADGWAEFATGLIVAHIAPSVYPEGSFDYVVFKRDSVAGETFTYRTEYYISPTIILSEPTTATVPEPCALAIWSLLGGLGLTVGYWRRGR
jgi:hypothetical protein